MKSKKIKVLSLILAVLMVISCTFVAGMTVSAATSSAGDVVYFDNSVTNWSKVNVYMWSDSSGNNGSWPGQAMTKVSDTVWAYNVTGSYDKIIFNDGSNQSDDLTYGGNGMMATPSSASGKFTVNWTTYSGDVTIPTSATTATTATQTPVTGDAGVVYMQNDAGWSKVNVYMWNSDSDNNGTWPGVAMTDLGDGIYEYKLPKSYANVIFNDGSTQTSDLTLPGDSYIYNNKTGAWEPYSAGPVKISALETDIKSPAYTTCNIVISATAKSTEGDVTYKFTANGPTGTSLLYEGASNQVSWVPTVAGNYTITVDVTDTAGNSSSRSINYVICDATTLETAFIKAFSNSLGTKVQLKQNTAVAFTMEALGGNTGNGLLFYKFAITEPDSATNTAYYTTSNTYSYTPTKLGVYTVKVSVQNSYNKTVTNTYTYNCVTTINEDDNTTVPTAPTGVTVPTTTQKPTSTTQATTAVTIKLGDVNQDGTINVNDVTAIQKHIASIKTIDTTYADTDRNGKINIKDATQIQKLLVGMISAL